MHVTAMWQSDSVGAIPWPPPPPMCLPPLVAMLPESMSPPQVPPRNLHVLGNWSPQTPPTFPLQCIPAHCGQMPMPHVMSAQTIIYQVTGGIEEVDTALPSPACESDSDEGDYCESGSAVLDDGSPAGDPVLDLPPPTADALPERLGRGSWCFPSACADSQGETMDHEHMSMAKMIADLQKQLAIAIEEALTSDSQPVFPCEVGDFGRHSLRLEAFAVFALHTSSN